MSSNRLIAVFVAVSSLIACESSHKQPPAPAVGAGSTATVATEVPSAAQANGHGGDLGASVTVGTAGSQGLGGSAGGK